MYFNVKRQLYRNRLQPRIHVTICGYLIIMSRNVH